MAWLCLPHVCVHPITQVVAVQREADSRLSLIVQGVARGVVLRSTQTLPFAKADMQLLPDAEQLSDCARQGTTFLREQLRKATAGGGAEEEGAEEGTGGSAEADASSSADADDGVLRRLVMAAAQAEEEYWRPFEHANLSLSMHQTLSQPEYPLPADAMRDATAAVMDGLRQAPMAPAVCYGPAGRDQPASADAAAGDTLYDGCEPLLEALQVAMLEASSGEAPANARGEDDPMAPSEADEEESALIALEHQVWLELDLLLRTLSKLRGPVGKAPVPSQLLGLLPPPPAAGWPEGFDLEGMATQLRERYDGAIAEGETGQITLTHYVPTDHARVPVRRRVQRLSFAIWGVIAGQGVALQPLLDACSTKDRLRMALLRMRDVMSQIR